MREAKDGGWRRRGRIENSFFPPGSIYGFEFFLTFTTQYLLYGLTKRKYGVGQERTMHSVLGATNSTPILIPSFIYI